MKQATVAEHQLAIAVLVRRSARKAIEAGQPRSAVRDQRTGRMTTLRSIGLSSSLRQGRPSLHGQGSLDGVC